MNTYLSAKTKVMLWLLENQDCVMFKHLLHIKWLNYNDLKSDEIKLLCGAHNNGSEIIKWWMY